MKHFILAFLCHLMMTSFGTLMSQETPADFICQVDKGPAYHGTRVNCQHAGITSMHDIEDWMSPNITSLLLDYNNVISLNNASFSREGDWTNLRFLGLSHNKIASIEPFTFTHLQSLEVLNLSYNQLSLDKHSLDGQVFQGLGNLLELRLNHNQNTKKRGNYSDFLFKNLQNLVTLSLDTFNQDLEFGSLFNNTMKLSTLTLTGGMTAIKNESFESFKHLKLKKLIILQTRHLKYTEYGAFRYLEDLDWYILSHTVQDVATTLKSLAPFVNRTMKGLIFEYLNYDYRIVQLFKCNSVVTRNLARYLVQICVENFALRDSSVFLVESGVFSSLMLRRCLKTLDLGYNPIKGTPYQMFTLAFLRKLEYIKIMDGKYFTADFKTRVWKPPVCIKNMLSPSLDIKEGYRNDEGLRFTCDRNTEISALSGTKVDNVDCVHKALDPFFPVQNDKLDLKDNRLSTLPFELQNKTVHSSNLRIITFPKNLKIAIFNSLSYHGMDINRKLQIIGGENVNQLHLADNGLKYFIGPVIGFTNLKLFDLSKNNGSILSPSFFDTMSTVVHLNLAGMNLDIQFMAQNSRRLLTSLSHLKTLDLSDNKLRYLQKDTFVDNFNLTVLRLKGNRFELIPLKLNYVTELCWLDLRDNSIRQLSVPDINMLESHAKKSTSFSLSLEGNEFYCGCVNIRFLSWLQNTKIHLDNNRNYSCIQDSGQTTTTGQINDLEAIWRKCQGYRAFLFSFILAFFMVLGFLCCIMIHKFKTQLKALLLKTFWIRFIMKTPSDYQIGVYIGYADHDTILACQRICPFIEDELHLTTYVRHRDLLPGSDTAESIMEAVNCSWRVLLLVSKRLLDDRWSHFLLKFSTYAVQAENPGRMVLLLVSDDDHESLLTTLPSCVLRAVKEENIIHMTPQGKISYEDKQALKTALIYPG